MKSLVKSQSVGLNAAQNAALIEFKEKLEAKLGLSLSRSATVTYAVKRVLEQIDAETETKAT